MVTQNDMTPGNELRCAGQIGGIHDAQQRETVGQYTTVDEMLTGQETSSWSGGYLLAPHGVGTDTAALLLIAAGDHPQRLRSEAAWAHLCEDPLCRIGPCQRMSRWPSTLRPSG